MTAAEAAGYRLRFRPKPGVDYSWSLARAKDQYKLYDDAMAQLDGKAWAVVTHFGSGAGVAAFAAVAGVATNAVSAWVALCAVPAFVLSTLAVIFATVSRSPKEVAAPPEPEACAAYAEHYHGEPVPDWPAPTTEPAMVAIWNEACVVNREAVSWKSSWITSAMWMKCAAVASLVLPLACVVVEKCCR